MQTSEKETQYLKQKIKALNEELKKEHQKNQVRRKTEVVHISPMLFLTAGIGFRAVSRVLKVLGGRLGISKPPCAQTVVNWVSKLAVAKIDKFAYAADSLVSRVPSRAGSIFIIDISIALGVGKIPTVPGLDMDHQNRNEGAPKRKDVDCIAVAVAPSWTGETIAEFLEKAIRVVGKPAAFIKDGGRDPAKAVGILAEHGFDCHSIDDISHAVANLFKARYSKHPMFDTFVSACGKASKNLKQTLLAFLAPPKTTTKARFMNLHRLVKWADKILEHFPKGRVSKNRRFGNYGKASIEYPIAKRSYAVFFAMPFHS